MKCSKCNRQFNSSEYAVEYKDGYVCMPCYRSIPYVQKFESATKRMADEYEKKLEGDENNE